MKPCKLWTGARSRDGYGRARHKGRACYAHRLAKARSMKVQLRKLDGKCVRHICDNPPCVEPAHLRVGTQAQNVRDMDLKKRRGCVQGSEHPAAKLNERQVRELRRLHATGNWTQARLALRFGINRPSVSMIVNRRTWRRL